MKTICIISDMVHNTPTTKVKMFRFSEKYSWLTKTIEKEIPTKKIDRIECHIWFNSVEDAEQYLLKL